MNLFEAYKYNRQREKKEREISEGFGWAMNAFFRRFYAPSRLEEIAKTSCTNGAFYNAGIAEAVKVLIRIEKKCNLNENSDV